MIKVYDIKKEDPQLAQQLEAIRQLKPSHTPDVVDAVMQRIDSLPQPMVPTHKAKRRPLQIVSGVVAACFIGAVAVTFFLSDNNGAQAANVSSEMSYRFYEIYQYNNDYANDDSIDDASYLDNPITNFI